MVEGSARLGHLEAVRLPLVMSIVLTLFASETSRLNPSRDHRTLAVVDRGVAAIICLAPGDTAGALGGRDRRIADVGLAPYIRRPV